MCGETTSLFSCFGMAKKLKQVFLSFLILPSLINSAEGLDKRKRDPLCVAAIDTKGAYYIYQDSSIGRTTGSYPACWWFDSISW